MIIRESGGNQTSGYKFSDIPCPNGGNYVNFRIKFSTPVQTNNFWGEMNLLSPILFYEEKFWIPTVKRHAMSKTIHNLKKYIY